MQCFFSRDASLSLTERVESSAVADPCCYFDIGPNFWNLLKVAFYGQ